MEFGIFEFGKIDIRENVFQEILIREIECFVKSRKFEFGKLVFGKLGASGKRPFREIGVREFASGKGT